MSLQTRPKRGRRKDYAGRCFEAAWDFATWNKDVFKDNPNAFLCHGYIRQTIGSGFYISHAWCEVGDHVYDLVIPDYQRMLRADYYMIRDPTRYPLRRYSYKAACKLAAEIRTYGPWDPVFHELGLVIIPEASRDNLPKGIERAKYTVAEDLESKVAME